MRLGNEIPSGLVLKDREDFDWNAPHCRRQGAAGIGEEVHLPGERRPYGDLAADA